MTPSTASGPVVLPPQADLLSTVRLRIHPDLCRSTKQPGCVVLRAPASRNRLVLTPVQAAMLADLFAQPCTVPEALAMLLGSTDSSPWTNYGCPPLSEFYELILQACDCGVLISGEPAGTTLARKWPVSLPVPVGEILGTLAVIVSAWFVITAHWQTPAGWMQWVAGWAAGCALLSLGQMLAASVIVAGKGEARVVRVRWLALFPHLSVDAGEAVMGGRSCERAVAMLRIAPALAGAAVFAWQSPGLLAPLLTASFQALLPWPGGAMLQWIAALRFGPRFTVHSGALFEPRRRDVWARWMAWWAGLRIGHGLLILVWVVVWALLVLTAWARFWPGLAGDLQRAIAPWETLRPEPQFLLTALTITAVLGFAIVLIAWLNHWILRREVQRPHAASPAHPTSSALKGDPQELLRQVLLFHKLADSDRAVLAGAMQPVHLKKGEFVFQEDEPGDAFFVIIEGEFEVIKRNPAPSRGSKVIGRLGPGECFGEIALLEDTPRTASIRARRPGLVWRLAKPDFMRLVVAQVGVARIRETLQCAAFLGRLVFFAGWPFEDMVRFAQSCTIGSFAPGEQVLRAGEPNQWFYLVFDGAFEARDGKRALRQFGPGDYFGEISLLEGGRATASIFAIEESRCVMMIRKDFISFFAHDYRVGLRIEALASARLGSDIMVSR